MRKKKAAFQFKKALEKILEVRTFEFYDENIDRGSLYLEYDNCGGLTFDKLSRISELLGTKRINLNSRASHWAYSENTYGDDIYVGLECFEVKFGEIF